MDSMTERSAAVEAAREKLLTVPGVKITTVEADIVFQQLLDAYAAACRAEGADEMLRAQPCRATSSACPPTEFIYGEHTYQRCPPCAARAEKASAT